MVFHSSGWHINRKSTQEVLKIEIQPFHNGTLLSLLQLEVLNNLLETLKMFGLIQLRVWWNLQVYQISISYTFI